MKMTKSCVGGSLAAGLALTTLCSSPTLAAPGVASGKYVDMPAGAYVSDPAHTSVTARLTHMGFSNYTLRFDRVAAQYRFDPGAPETTQVRLDAADFPTVTFASTRIDIGDGVHGVVEGNLTLHGVTRPVTLAVTFNGVGGDLIPLVTRSGFSATTNLRRSDFGLTRYEGLVGDTVQLVIEVEFTRKLF